MVDRRDHRHRAPPRHRDLAAGVATRIVNTDSGSRIADGRARLRDDRLASARRPGSDTRGQPARAARRRAAADAGDGPLHTAGRRLAMTGDCTTAGRLADELLGSQDLAETRRGGPDRRQHRGARRQRRAGGRPVPVARAVSRRIRQRGGRGRAVAARPRRAGCASPKAGRRRPPPAPHAARRGSAVVTGSPFDCGCFSVNRSRPNSRLSALRRTPRRARDAGRAARR